MTVAADDLQRLRADIQRLERGGAMTKDTRFPACDWGGGN